MANWTILKEAIASVIKTNGNQEITGQVLQNVLNNIVTSVGENASLAGVATPATNPGVNDGNVFYFASSPGQYDNFGGLIVNVDEFAILYNTDSGWAKAIIFTNTDVDVITNLGNMASVEAAMNAAKEYAVVSKQNTRIIVWTHGNDAGIIFQTHLGMEHVRQLALLDGSPAKCKARYLTINITDHTVADGGWQELVTPVGFSYDSARRAITANGPKNPGNEPAISWPVVTLPLAGSSYAGLMEPADKKKLGCIVDLGVVSNQAAAENAAAERSITENSDVRIIMWRTGDNGKGDGGQIIQSRWGSYYVAQVMMFVGQEYSCRYRLITTGGNYRVGNWNDLIIPSRVYYDPGIHRVMYNAFFPDVEKELFEIPVADDEELGLVRIGKPFYMGENDELNIQIGGGLMFGEDDSIRIKVGAGLRHVRDNSIAINISEYFIIGDDGALEINIDYLKTALGL